MVLSEGTTQRVETILHNCERLVRRLSKLTQTQVHHILSALEKAGASAPSPTYRAAARYFRTVMDTSSQVVLSHISRLSNSLARHYLRVIFLYFDDRLSEDKASTVALPDHYAHQDLGAAIHRALDDRLLYETSQTTVKERYLYATSVNFLYQAIQLVQQTAKDAYLTSLIRKLQALCLRLIQYDLASSPLPP
ncbi:hypothetical protein DYB32_008116 [Aphanomyces invadans]|uniref:Uncharacterized protein n=1 Tax=Aphanomyces invadans TaxID=157072 RepID=A0A418AM32_9STRA|nr:hypothetical protein DYB32_008116 [Aphanomyces invadans]